MSFLPTLIMEYGGINYNWEQLTGELKWEDVKPHTPFGQFPYLVHGDIKIAQSGAIVRYVAKITGLQGGTDGDFAKSEMLISEYEDIFRQFGKAKYNQDSVKAWDDLLLGWLPQHLACLEKLLPDDSPYFTRLGPFVGDFAIFVALNIALDCEPQILNVYPKLQRFYTQIATLPSLQTYFARPIERYFVRVVAQPPPPRVEPPKQALQSSLPTSDYGPGIHGRRILQAPGGTSTINLYG